MNDQFQLCTRCVTDTTVPGARFDINGVCSYCHLHDKLDRLYPLSPVGDERLERIVAGIRERAHNRKYDCIVGVSGGRDSTYTLWYLVKVLGLRPLAVHFNDGFGNPQAGENMIKATKKLNIDLRTITSDWRESKDLRLAFLKASTPDLGIPTDIGIATALYGAAVKEGVQSVIIGQSFRTEGVAPLEWSYLDGKYVTAVHKIFGSYDLRRWKPTDPGFNLKLIHMFYYLALKRVKTIALLYYIPYIRKNVDEMLGNELGWINPGAHYYDDLYQSLMTYVLRKKFNIDRRKFNYSALVRSGQMSRDEALGKLKEVYVIEDPKVIDLCIKRLGLTREQFEEFMKLPPKTFRDYPSHYNLIKSLRLPIWILSRIGVIPVTAYEKYFSCV